MKKRLIMIAFATVWAVGFLGCRPGTLNDESRSIKTVDFACPDTAPLYLVASDADRDYLIRYFSSSPQWRVHNDGAIVADLRSDSNEGESQVHIRIRFGAYEKTPPWSAGAVKHDRVSISPAGISSAFDMRLWESSSSTGVMGSYVIISGKGIWIEILEWSNDESRKLTSQGIDAAISEISRVMAATRKNDSAEYWREVLPSGALSNKESLIVDRNDFGEVKIYGFVNPGKQGMITVRIFDSVSGDELDEIHATLQRSEYVGWCGDEGVFFPFQCYYIPPDMEQERDVRFEAWFYPSAPPGRLVLSEDRLRFKVVE